MLHRNAYAEWVILLSAVGLTAVVIVAMVRGGPPDLRPTQLEPIPLSEAANHDLPCCGGGDPVPIGGGRTHIDECCKMLTRVINGEVYFGAACVDCIVPVNEWADCYVWAFNVVHIHDEGIHLLHLRLQCTNGPNWDDPITDHEGFPLEAATGPFKARDLP